MTQQLRKIAAFQDLNLIPGTYMDDYSNPSSRGSVSPPG